MSSPSDPSSTSPSPTPDSPRWTSVFRRPGFRFVLIAALIFAEITLLRTRFSTRVLKDREEWWASYVQLAEFSKHSHWVLCVLGVLLLLGWKNLRTEALRVAEESVGHRPFPQAWVHIAFFGGFYAVTATLLESPLATGPGSGWWVLAWVLLGIGLGLTLLWIGIPLGALGRALDRRKLLLASGLGIGTIVFFVGSYVASTWPFWQPMVRGTLWLAHGLLGFVVEDRYFSPEDQVLGTLDFRVKVTKECSGYEGASLFFVFFVVFLILWRDRLRFPNALFLLPIGMVVIWLVNAVRVAALVVIALEISPDAAIDGFHVNAGWPLICAVSLGFVAVASRIGFFAEQPTARTEGTVNPTALYVVPLLIVVAMGMVLGAFTAVPAAVQPLASLLALAYLVRNRREYESTAWRGSLSAVALGTLGAILWAALFPLTTTPAEDPLAWQAGAPTGFLVVWWIARTFGLVIVTPMVEELAFRGFLMRRFVSADFEKVSLRGFHWWPVIGSSILFGLVHQAWLAGTIVGVVYALAAVRRGRLFDAVLAHATTNGILFGMAVASGDWSLLF